MQLDPAVYGVRVPNSQRWAVELLAEAAPELAQHNVAAATLREAVSALSASRGPIVLRRLSALRKEHRDGDMTRAGAALGILEIVADEGLRLVTEADETQPPSIDAERVRLICYQVVHHT